VKVAHFSVVSFESTAYIPLMNSSHLAAILCRRVQSFLYVLLDTSHCTKPCSDIGLCCAHACKI
jgi:hypothetical protein